jgi:hypothetical protein
LITTTLFQLFGQKTPGVISLLRDELWIQRQLASFSAMIILEIRKHVIIHGLTKVTAI